MDTSKNILIIDDEKDLREALKTAFEYEGYTTHIAEDGEEGFEVASSVKPDIILLDLVMPKTNGIEVLKKIRATEWGHHTKIIVMTMLDDFEKIAQVLEAGGDEYIVKSKITLSSIVEKVKAKLV